MSGGSNMLVQALDTNRSINGGGGLMLRSWGVLEGDTKSTRVVESKVRKRRGGEREEQAESICTCLYLNSICFSFFYIILYTLFTFYSLVYYANSSPPQHILLRF